MSTKENNKPVQITELVLEMGTSHSLQQECELMICSQ